MRAAVRFGQWLLDWPTMQIRRGARYIEQHRRFAREAVKETPPREVAQIDGVLDAVVGQRRPD